VPEVARACLAALGTQLLSLKKQIVEFDRMILAWHRSNQTSKRLHYIPGVGPMLATALVASVADPRTFRSGRNFSAWIGLVPRRHSSGGKTPHGAKCSPGTADGTDLPDAGAPEIEVTPAMIAAGVAELPILDPSAIGSMSEETLVFRVYLAMHSRAAIRH
jgi:hypothetical protein